MRPRPTVTHHGNLVRTTRWAGLHEGDAVVVRLKGACAGCPRAALDLKGVVEALLRRRFPAIREVRNLY